MEGTERWKHNLLSILCMLGRSDGGRERENEEDKNKRGQRVNIEDCEVTGVTPSRNTSLQQEGSITNLLNFWP